MRSTLRRKNCGYYSKRLRRSSINNYLSIGLTDSRVSSYRSFSSMRWCLGRKACESEEDDTHHQSGASISNSVPSLNRKSKLKTKFSSITPSQAGNCNLIFFNVILEQNHKNVAYIESIREILTQCSDSVILKIPLNEKLQ